MWNDLFALPTHDLHEVQRAWFEHPGSLNHVPSSNMFSCLSLRWTLWLRINNYRWVNLAYALALDLANWPLTQPQWHSQLIINDCMFEPLDLLPRWPLSQQINHFPHEIEPKVGCGSIFCSGPSFTRARYHPEYIVVSIKTKAAATDFLQQTVWLKL